MIQLSNRGPKNSRCGYPAGRVECLQVAPDPGVLWYVSRQSRSDELEEPEKKNAYCRDGEELVKSTQEDANAYSRQQDVQPLGHLGDAFPCDLVAAIFRGERLTASLTSANGCGR